MHHNLDSDNQPLKSNHEAKFITTLISVLFAVLEIHADKITFAYDLAGNWVRRELVLQVPVTPLSERPGLTASCVDPVGDRTVMISHNSHGEILISIMDFCDDDTGLAEITIWGNAPLLQLAI